MNYDTETIIVEAEKSLSSAFEKINETALCNQKKVLDAFRNHCVAARHFYGTTGYGYDDVGRDTLNKIYAEVFGCEAAIVSPYISSSSCVKASLIFLSAFRIRRENAAVGFSTGFVLSSEKTAKSAFSGNRCRR